MPAANKALLHQNLIDVILYPSNSGFNKIYQLDDIFTM